MKPHITYLVGPMREYRRFVREYSVSDTDTATADPRHAGRGTLLMHVESVSDLPAYDREPKVVFLNRWMELPEWRAIYSKCLANGWAQPWKREGP